MNKDCLTLILKKEPVGLVDARSINPSDLGNLGMDLTQAPVLCRNEPYMLEDLFQIRMGDPRQIVLKGDLRSFDYLGAGLREGMMEIIGDCGDYAGMDMAGGHMLIRGQCGDYAGAGMSGGILEIEDCGDYCGSWVDEPGMGMSGGTIIVRGTGGTELGRGMGRGTIVVRGGCGENTGLLMKGGTMLLYSQPDVPSFQQMKRGTVFILEPASQPGLTFRYCCNHVPAFYPILKEELRALGVDIPDIPSGGFYLFRGDEGSRGRGEIFISGQDGG